jgi:hypothetical protein
VAFRPSQQRPPEVMGPPFAGTTLTITATVAIDHAAISS